MIDIPNTFICISCNKEKTSYFLFYAKGQTMCLWCAEDHGLTKPRQYSDRKRFTRRYY